MMRSRRLAAFSLIEVLISVLVLALGLLGLGAVFPVVIRQQRLATDATLGVTAANAARLEIQGNASLRGSPMVQPNGGGSATATTGPTLGWTGWGNYLGVPNRRNRYWTPFVNQDTGELTIGQSAGATTKIKLGARLFPAAHNGAADPRYVWDMIGRSLDNGMIDVVVFVRPLDQNMRVPPGSSLSNVLAPIDNAGNLLNPTLVGVGLDATSNLPTYSGVGKYARPVAVDAEPMTLDDEDRDPANDRDRITLRARSDDPLSGDLVDLAARTGQKLVDRFGTIYTVVGLAPATRNGAPERTVIVEPRIPLTVRDAQDLSPLYFVPQVPASVTRFTVRY